MESWPFAKAITPLALTAALATACVPTVGVTPSAKPLTLAKGTGALKPGTGTIPGNGLISDHGGGLITDNGGGLITDHGGGLISNNTGNLVGTAKVPAHLITDNGGGLITDNGGGYRLLTAPDQVPLAGATVRVLDASGAPVTDAAGKPLTTTTDAQGRYALTVAGTARHLIVSIALPEGKGALSAIAVKESRGAKPVDADLFSTLATGYVVSQYVRGQKDPLSTLEKLPAEVEAETRAKVAAAFAKTDLTVPALAETDVVAAVEKLKAADAPFRAQLEKVRQLLVAAGQSDLGAGRLGTQVSLGAIRNVALADDGSLYITCPNAHRIWRLAKDGRLYTAAGSGTPTQGSLDGKPGAEAGLQSPLGVTLDAEGRPLIVEGGARRVSRLEADGRLKSLMPGLKRTPRLAVGGPDGRLHVFTVEDSVAEYWSAMPGETPTVKHTFAAGELAALKGITTYGLDAKGRVCFSSGDKAAYRFDPQTLTLTPVTAASASTVHRATFDGRGNLVVLDQAPDGRRLRVITPDDAVKPLLDKQGGLLIVGTGVAYTPQGHLYMDNWGVINRLEAGKLTAVAGTNAANAATLDELVLTNPSGVACLPTGELIVADSNLGSKVWKVKADRSVVRIAGGGGVDRNLEGGEAAEMRLGFVSRVKTDASGQVYFYESTTTEQTVRRLDTAGKLHTIYRATAAEPFRDLAVAPDGTVYLSLAKLDTAKQVLPEKTVWRLKPGETTPSLLLTETLAHDATFTSFISLAVGPDGALYLAMTHNDVGYLKRWTEAQGLKTLKQASQFKVLWGTENTSMALDAQGRVYVANSWDNQLHRYDPALDAITAVAGQGTARFGGSGVDDSLEKPRFPAFNSTGDLYFADSGHQQVKRIPAADLP